MFVAIINLQADTYVCFCAFKVRNGNMVIAAVIITMLHEYLYDFGRTIILPLSCVVEYTSY